MGNMLIMGMFIKGVFIMGVLFMSGDSIFYQIWTDFFLKLFLESQWFDTSYHLIEPAMWVQKQ